MGQFEDRPQLRFGPPPVLRDRRLADQKRALQQVRAGDEVVDPIEEHRPHGLEDDLVFVGVQLAGHEPAVGGQPA